MLAYRSPILNVSRKLSEFHLKIARMSKISDW